MLSITLISKWSCVNMEKSHVGVIRRCIFEKKKEREGGGMGWTESLLHQGLDVQATPRNLKGGIRSLFYSCVNAMGQRRPYWPSCMEVSIVPLDLARSFSVICAHYRYPVIHRAITYMRVWFKSTRERQLTLNEIACGISYAWEALLRRRAT